MHRWWKPEKRTHAEEKNNGRLSTCLHLGPIISAFEAFEVAEIWANVSSTNHESVMTEWLR